MNECRICPDYVEACAHFEGRAIWLVSKAASRNEEIRRGFIEDGTPCPGCGRPLGPSPARFVVGGPGRIEEPRCPCMIGLTVPNVRDWSSYHETLEQAQTAFAFAEARLLAKGE